MIQLADLFGVSTDYLLKDEMLPETAVSYVSTVPEDVKPFIRVTMEDANAFLEMKRKSAPMIANATFMCIISPVLLVLLSTMADGRILHVTETLASAAGLIFLFGMIAAAVFIFITSGMQGSHMEHLEKDSFETEYGVSGMVKEKRRAYEGTFTRGIAIGVVLCILSVVPLIVVGAMEAPDYICGIFTAVLLVMIAVGVNLIIRVSIVKSSYDILLQDGEFSTNEKKAKKKLDAFSGVYWCLATAIYLGWSFWTMNWRITWIIWPVAGVLFAAVSGIIRMIMKLDEE